MSAGAARPQTAASVRRRSGPEHSSTNTPVCPSCGSSLSRLGGQAPVGSQHRIDGLESQVRFLTEKASTAADKLADCEDELRRLKGARDSSSIPEYSGATDNHVTLPPDMSSAKGPAQLSAPQSRFGSLLTRKASPAPVVPAASSTTNSNQSRREVDLEAALAREQDLRAQAEGKVNQMNTELEELSAQLFQQANEMVAAERKARAKLEERVAILEQRDVEKRKRLERLEGAMKRIEHVRGMLGS
ncbi:hypothetical protein BDY21DRAFT_366920 [Lineolata rhizophorae]|uniref:GDP/GTP exchange factor Sec2 N-terminal domain-containing protein n=1 Tax=Lineolata rhizophorae TaxID=578093 RepID=A0A6A6NQ48_9PEZI|nr:hypothetical protein BDY21DRAFT_366920 [Lineolata rhizophorae]